MIKEIHQTLPVDLVEDHCDFPRHLLSVCLKFGLLINSGRDCQPLVEVFFIGHDFVVGLSGHHSREELMEFSDFEVDSSSLDQTFVSGQNSLPEVGVVDSDVLVKGLVESVVEEGKNWEFIPLFVCFCRDKQISWSKKMGELLPG
jgi:hypothetical protein